MVKLATPTITPQKLPCTPVYTQIQIQDYLSLTPTTFLHYYNDSNDSVAIIVSSVEPDSTGNYHCYVVILSANEEKIVGPFNLTRYAPIISLSTICKYPDGVVAAALWSPLTSVIPRHHDLAGSLRNELRCDVALEARGGRHVGLLEPDLTVDT